MSVVDRLRTVKEHIAEAAERSGRAPEAVRLVGVSKGVEPALVIEAVEAGLTDVGENRVQEASDKIPAVNQSFSVPPRWHLVGHLQSNKAKLAAALFDTIDTVDSLGLAAKLAHLAAAPPLPVMLEVQFAPIEGRFGFDPGEMAEIFDEIVTLPN